MAAAVESEVMSSHHLHATTPTSPSGSARPRRLSFGSQTSGGSAQRVASEQKVHAVIRKDPYDLSNEVIAVLRRHDTLAIKVGQEYQDPGPTHREDLEWARKRGAFKSWVFLWFTLKLRRAAVEKDERQRMAAEDERDLNDSEEFFIRHDSEEHFERHESEEDKEWARKTLFDDEKLEVVEYEFAWHDRRDEWQIAASRFDPKISAERLWGVKSESAISWHDPIHRVEKYKGVMGRLLVPDYTKEDRSGCVTRPTRFPREYCKDGCVNIKLPSISSTICSTPVSPPKRPLLPPQEGMHLRQADFKVPEIVETLERGRTPCSQACATESEKERTLDPKWSDKFGAVGGTRQRKTLQVPAWF